MRLDGVATLMKNGNGSEILWSQYYAVRQKKEKKDCKRKTNKKNSAVEAKLKKVHQRGNKDKLNSVLLTGHVG